MQSCSAESSMQTMPTKTAGKGLQRVTSRVRYVTNPDKPRPREHATKGARPCCAASFKINVLKQQFIYCSSRRLLCTRSHTHTHTLSLSLSRSLSLSHTHTHTHTLCLSLSLSFRSSDHFSHSYDKPYTWTRLRLLCCIKALIRIKPYIKS